MKPSYTHLRRYERHMRTHFGTKLARLLTRRFIDALRAKFADTEHLHHQRH